MTEDNNLLLDYLNEILPTLGLDSETYAPYVMGCFENIDYDNDEADGLLDETLDESLTEIIGLLQASSETHSDDESAWEELKSEVLKRHLEVAKEVQSKKDAELLEKKKVSDIYWCINVYVSFCTR